MVMTLYSLLKSILILSRKDTELCNSEQQKQSIGPESQDGCEGSSGA